MPRIRRPAASSTDNGKAHCPMLYGSLQDLHVVGGIEPQCIVRPPGRGVAFLFGGYCVRGRWSQAFGT